MSVGNVQRSVKHNNNIETLHEFGRLGMAGDVCVCVCARDGIVSKYLMNTIFMVCNIRQ